MKKILSILLSLFLIGSLTVSAFATNGNEYIPNDEYETEYHDVEYADTYGDDEYENNEYENEYEDDEYTNTENEISTEEKVGFFASLFVLFTMLLSIIPSALISILLYMVPFIMFILQIYLLVKELTAPKRFNNTGNYNNPNQYNQYNQYNQPYQYNQYQNQGQYNYPLQNPNENNNNK